MDPSLARFSGAVYDMWAFLQASVRPDEPAVFAKPSANQLTVSGQARQAPQEAAEVVQLKRRLARKRRSSHPRGIRVPSRIHRGRRRRAKGAKSMTSRRG